jgi:FixJ family two-component response regulator
LNGISGCIASVNAAKELDELLAVIAGRHDYIFKKFNSERELQAALGDASHAVVAVELFQAGKDQLLHTGLLNFTYAKILVAESPTVEMVVHAMRMGCHSVITWRPDLDCLSQSIELAMAASTVQVEKLQRRIKVINVLNSMTEGELQVLGAVVEGQLNKRIAKGLEISERTVEARRKRIFEKTETKSVARLVRLMVETIGIDELRKRCERKERVSPPAPHVRPPMLERPSQVQAFSTNRPADEI